MMKEILLKQALEQNEELKKKAKAFDLIKKKEVNVLSEIFNCDDYYNDYLYEMRKDRNAVILTEEEWYFLKEMLKGGE